MLAIVLYSRTLGYYIAGDDLCIVDRAIHSGPWWSLYIGRDTLRQLLETEEFQGDVEVAGSDIFRPGLIWFYKAGYALFGRWDTGYRILYIVTILCFACCAGAVTTRIVAPGNPWIMPVTACLLLVNPRVQYLATFQTCEAQSFAAATFVCAGAIAHDNWAASGNRRWLAVSAGLLALGLCFRENAVVLLVFAPLLDLLRRRSLRVNWRAWAVYGSVMTSYFVLRLTYYGGTLGNYQGFRAQEQYAHIVYHVRSTLPDVVASLPGSALACQIGHRRLLMVVLAGALVLLWLSRRPSVTMRSAGLLVLGAYLAFGPGYMTSLFPSHELLPAILFVSALLVLTLSARPTPAARRRTRLVFLVGCLSVWGTYLANSVCYYVEWGVGTRKDVLAQTVRKSIREGIESLNGSGDRRKLVICLLCPVSTRFCYYENSMAPAIGFWTDQRCEGHSLFWFKPASFFAPSDIKIERIAGNRFTLYFRNCVFLPPQTVNFGPHLWNETIDVVLTRRQSETEFHTATITISPCRMREFERTYVIAHDGKEFIYCQEAFQAPVANRAPDDKPHRRSPPASHKPQEVE